MKEFQDLSNDRTISISDQLLAKVAEHTDGYITISDVDDRIVWVNKSLINRTGYTLEELVGRKPGEVFRGPDTDLEKAELIDQAFEDGNEFEGDILNYTKDGEPFWIHLTTNRICDIDGIGEFYICLGADITEKKKYQEQIEQALSKAERINKEKQQLLSVLSHDIKSPLNSITGVLDLLSNDTNTLSDGQNELLDVIRMAADSTIRLVDNMLSMAKIESNKFTISPRKVDLSALLQEVITPLRLQAEVGGIKLSTRIDPGLYGFWNIDPIRFSQLINNLVSNAIKFTEEGSIEVVLKKLETDPSTHETIILLKVKDTGIGMKEEVQQKIFSDFEQADLTVEQKYGGNGFGLSICKTIMDKMNGTISVESKEGEGAAFYLRFPVKKVFD